MKAEELMIGDWVIDKEVSDKPVQIEQINEKNVHYKCGNGYISSGVELLEPVPITPEILEKNGFRLKEESDSHKEYIAMDELCIIVLYFYKETIYGVSTLLDCERVFAGGLDRIHKCNLLYVHQLQHALRLCAVNKIIEL